MKMLILFAVLGIIGFLFMGYGHEFIHQRIYADYGIKSKIDLFGHFPSMVTIADKPCPTESCTTAQELNEIVGYPLTVFYFLLFILGFFIFEKITENEI